MKWKVTAALTLALSGMTGLVASAMSTQTTAFIKGGTEVGDNELPFVVDIEVKVVGGENWQHACGSSLIAPDTVITAAHCLVDPQTGQPYPQIQDYRLVFQRADRAMPAEIIVDSSAFSMLPHPSRDVGLILLSHDVEGVPTAELPEPNVTPAPGSVATVAGWGYTEDDVEPERMRRVDVPIIASDRCDVPYVDARSVMADVAFPRLCAGTAETGTGPGDSGGPLFRLNDQTGKYVILGTVSGGRVGYPDGYVNLADPELWDGFYPAWKRPGAK